MEKFLQRMVTTQQRSGTHPAAENCVHGRVPQLAGRKETNYLLAALEVVSIRYGMQTVERYCLPSTAKPGPFRHSLCRRMDFDWRMGTGAAERAYGMRQAAVRCLKSSAIRNW